MPLEIKELHIKISVENEPSSNSGGGGNASGEPDEATVQACVEKVLEILKEKSER